MDMKKVIAEIDVDIEKIADPAIRILIVKLLNIIEAQAAEIKELKAEIQMLRDENNRLKGEQGKPSIRPQSTFNKDLSSEKERKNRENNQKKKKAKAKKKGKIKVDRVQVCKMDQSILPVDAVFKGYQSVIVQDLLITPNNIEFKKEVYYSASLKKNFMAPNPPGYEGEFGPVIKSLVVDMHHDQKTSESGIHRFLTNHGIFISLATISRLMTDHHEGFHQEKKEIVMAGLMARFYQQMDDTGARFKGLNHYTHILCHELYTAYFTRPNKNRLTVIEILTQGDLTFVFNEVSYTLMKKLNVSEKALVQLKKSEPKTVLNREGIDILLNNLFPNPKKQHTNRQGILEASAIVAYQQLPHAVGLLMVDDAPQFKQITPLTALCWIHDARHYKKLSPVILSHRKLLEEFLTCYWDYYHQLLAYKAEPCAVSAEKLINEFDQLFTTKTGYAQLDDRIEKTKAKKESLLLVLNHPTIPLHNNASELGARVQARYRDMSLHTVSEKGTESKDTFMTLVDTARKLAVNSFHYLLDRISGKNEMPSLSNLIKARSMSVALS